MHCNLQVIYLEEGRIAAQGTFEQVRENERFISLLQEFNSGGAEDDIGDDADSAQASDSTTSSHYPIVHRSFVVRSACRH